MKVFLLMLVSFLSLSLVGCESGFSIGANTKTFYTKENDPRSELYKEGYTETTYPGHSQARGFAPLISK